LPYTKTIICLANSRKLAGRCVAGKEWDGRAAGPWRRPVSARDRGELTAERWYGRTWRDPQLLDVIEMTLVGPRLRDAKSKTISGVRWKFLGRIRPHQFVPGLDRVTGPLWVNGGSTTAGCNDRVPAELAERQPNSLVLVQPEHLAISVGMEGTDENLRRRVRGRFSLAGYDYGLSITDPIVEAELKPLPDGSSIQLHKPILCISLSEKFPVQNACYKLIAGVIRTSS
jgi:hypothetical protein